MTEIEHELPCGHVLTTSALLDGMTEFDSSMHLGAGPCLICGRIWQAEFVRMPLSNGTTRWDATYLCTGRYEEGPESDFVVHQRRRVPGLIVDGSVAHLGLREWALSK
jgi:hypothetical protein